MTITSAEMAGDDAPRLALVLLFEGVDLAITNTNDVAGIAESWSGATEWTNFRGGLHSTGTIHNRAQPFDAEIQVPELTFEIIDDDLDTLARLMLRTANTDAFITTLGSPLNNSDTFLVPDTMDFGLPDSGILYVGTEAVEYSEIIPDPIMFALSQRGKWSLFGTQDDPDHFGQYHLVPSTPLVGPRVSDVPLQWNGRMVALYLCINIDGTWTAAGAAECIFAGTIREIVDTDGHISLTCVSVLQKLNTKLLRRQYRGYLEEGMYLEDPLRGHFRVTVVRTQGGGSPSIYRPTAANILSGSDVYTHTDIATAINTQLATWFDGTSTYFDDDMTMELVLAAGEGGDFYEFRLTDTQAGDFAYAITVELNSLVFSLLGIRYQTRNHSSTYQSISLSENPGLDDSPPTGVNYQTRTAEDPPLRAALPNSRDPSAPFTPVSTVGEFNPQPTIPDDGGSAAWDDVATTAFFRIGGKHIVAASHTGLIPGPPFDMNGSLGAEFERLGIVPLDGSSARLLDGVDFQTIEGVNTNGVVVEQVWFETSPANEILMRLLLSTGTPAYNHEDYDDHPEQMGLGLPWGMIDHDSLFDNLAADDYVLFLGRSTPFQPLFESALQVRNLHCYWHRGKIRVTGFGETDEATTQITTDHMGRVIQAGQARGAAADPLKVSSTLDYLVNEITLNYNIPFGSHGNRKPSTVVVTNDASKTDTHEEAGADCDAIGFYDGVAIIGEGGVLTSWQDNVAAPALAYFGRPLCAVPVRYDIRLFTEMHPGKAVLLTNPTVFHPGTGVRGVVDLPCWVVETVEDYETMLGEALLLFQPEAVTAP